MAKEEFVGNAAVYRCSTARSMTFMEHHHIVGTVYTCSCLHLWLLTLVAVNSCGCLRL